MKILKKICTLCLIFVLPIITCACKNTNNKNAKFLCGVLIYQNALGNQNYNSEKDNIKSLITINDSEISTTNEFVLYFNFNDSTNTNTTYTLSDNSLTLEIFLETTEITACLIYKDVDGNLSYSKQTTLSVDDSDLIIFESDTMSISVSKNLSYKKG